MKFGVFLVLAFSLSSCLHTSPDTLFKQLDSDQTHIEFINSIQETETDNVLNYEYFYNGGGVAAADFNNDGLIDLYFTANQGEDKLYINEGKLSFKDVTQTAGITWKGEWKTGVTIVDINQDGWQDLYVSVSGNVQRPELRRNKLYINNGKGRSDVSGPPTFTEKAAEYGLDLNTYTTQTAFFDYDRDGDLDAYILNHNVKDFNRFDVEAVRAMRDSLAGDRLLRNDGGKFVDVSAVEGIKGNPIGFGLGIHIADINQDGWPDIYVSNDYLENDYCYINNGRTGGPAFSDQITRMTNHVSYFSMGNDIGDVNNDLLPDIITADMLPEDNKRQKLLFGPDKYEGYLSMLRNGIHPQIMRNMLQLNNGAWGKGQAVISSSSSPQPHAPSRPVGPPMPTFSEIGQVAGISNTDWSWSVLLADYDNDGYKDLFMTNGYLRDYTNMDFMKYYADQGERSSEGILGLISHMPSTKVPNYIFRNEHNLTFSNKQAEWGFSAPVISNGAVYADLDNDGDLEIITNNINEKAGVYQNLSTEKSGNNYLNVVLNAGSNKAFTTGTKLYLYSGSLKQFQEYSPTHGFQSSLATPVHFGLGANKSVDSLVVVWPDGKEQKLTGIAANQRLTVTYAKNLPAWNPAAPASSPLFMAAPVFPFAHQQMPLNDFSRQILLPHMYSFQGPRMAKGDVNGDGLEDVYIGGGKGQAGGLFVQQANGTFSRREQPDFAQDELCTDTDAVLFDIDKDGDLDLYVTSGGYEYLPNDLMLRNRLYRNDGKGNFKKDFDALPAEGYADNAVETIDFDRDGDLDLFVGGGAVPGIYPSYNPSRLYRNDGGKLVPVASPALESLGLLTDACVIDFDRDGYDDLVAVGEWTPVIRLRNNRGVLERVPDDTDTLTGFWQRIACADFDRDGDLDLIVGNYGLNSQWKASTESPLTMAVADFDDNGKADPILSYAIQGKSYPAYSRDELLDQLVPLRKKYTNYALYSEATTEDVLNEFKNKTPQMLKASTLSTVYLVNNNGKFEPKALPVQAQFAPVYAIACEDINGDGYKDLLLGGNQSRGRVRTGNIDANFGQVFLNDRRGHFRYLPQTESGLYLRGDTRDFLFIRSYLLVGINSQPVHVYTKSSSPDL
ncbi:VCBS repeat-containing protein [Nibrella viscosa]|uniref:VCBS repeat-containing protein n=1 Tax=Nibrella viscosa TaxID=1084524 RepID=A0ABP8KGT6_9BACT